tara:strand:- start:150 stop:527 length:378 start_codon:yes stop_codon:yes gene_type:complete
MAFKLGQRSEFSKTMNLSAKFNKDTDASVPGTPVIRKKLAKGIMGEANADGSIFISDKIEPGSQEERAVLQHEMKHIVDMKTGKLSYTDNSITWMGETHERKNGMINYNGRWFEEGDKNFPWEQH